MRRKIEALTNVMLRCRKFVREKRWRKAARSTLLLGCDLTRGFHVAQFPALLLLNSAAGREHISLGAAVSMAVAVILVVEVLVALTESDDDQPPR